jgi:hypothetical protein
MSSTDTYITARLNSKITIRSAMINSLKNLLTIYAFYDNNDVRPFDHPEVNTQVQSSSDLNSEFEIPQYSSVLSQHSSH